MAKKNPRYMQNVSASIKPAKKVGNPSEDLNHFVALLDENDRLQWSAGDIVREEVKERYVWNQDHRRTTKAKKGHWEIPEAAELAMFVACRRNGGVVKWKADTYTGWGVLVVEKGKLIKIGRAENRKVVAVGKFVEGTKSEWHGYPIDYREEHDIICDNALLYWYKVLKIIEKSEIDDIRRQFDSSLVLEV